MPRTEQPIEGDGPLAQFATDLRHLRAKAGRPPYRQLAREAKFSASALADAASGRKLPTLDVTLAYVRACDGDADEWEARWQELAAELAAVTTDPREDAGDSDEQSCPYVGLAAFQPGDAHRFFGRERLTDDVVSRIRKGRFLAVFGASGSGKSSLLRAGVLPRLEAGDSDAGVMPWPVVLFTPGAHPLEECAAYIAAFGSMSAVTVHRDIAGDPRGLHRTVLRAMADRPEDTDLVIVVDQFEELFSICESPSEREAFLSALLTAAQAANSRTRVVLGMRADFYARCSEHPELVDALHDAQLLVGPMSVEELRRAVVQPAVEANCTVESPLLARIVADTAGQANVLPLASHALRETWRQRRGNSLGLPGYEAAGGIRHALTRSAEMIYRGMPPGEQRLLRATLLSLVAPGAGTEDTKRRVAPDSLPPQARPVLEALARARLVTFDSDTVEITHEALLHEWPRLRRWLDDDRAGRRTHRQLVDAADAWVREGHEPGLLLRGTRLATATEWARTNGNDALIGTHVREFLAASSGQERRAARLRRSALILLSVLTLVTSGSAVVALHQGSTARAQRDRAAAGQLLTRVEQLADADSALAAQFGVAAYRAHPTPEAATALVDTGNVALPTTLDAHTGAARAVAFSPDRHTMATGGDEGTIRLWDVSDLTRPAAVGKPIAAHTGPVLWLAFSPDGRTLASGGPDRTARLWNVSDPAHAAPWGPPLTGHEGSVYSVSFGGGGRILVTAGSDSTLRLWDVSDPAHAAAIGPPLRGHAGPVASAAVGPDGHTVASAGHDHSVRLWDITDPLHPAARATLTDPGGDEMAVAFSHDGRTLAGVGEDRAVRLWDIRDPEHPVAAARPLTGHTDTVLAVAFSADDRLLATGGADNTLRLWDMSDPRNPGALGPPLVGHTGMVTWAAFGPDGRTLASTGKDHSVRLWNLPRAATGHAGAVYALRYSPDGRTLASAGADHTVRLWDATQPTGPVPRGAPLTEHTDEVTGLAYGTGGLLVSTGRDHVVRLWNVTDPDRPRLFSAVPGGVDKSVGAAAIAPDGRTLAVDGARNTLQLWDVADPAHPARLAEAVGTPNRVRWAGISPDGRTLAAVGSDDAVRLWDIRDRARPRALAAMKTGNSTGSLWAAFAPGGRLLAVAGADRTIQLWDIGDPAHPRPVGNPLSGHADQVTWVGFAPDGRTLASTGAEGTLRLWDVTDPARATTRGQPLTAGHTGAIIAAAYSPDGSALASAGADRIIHLSTSSPESAARRICATTRGTLTPERWREYLPDLDYSPPC